MDGILCHGSRNTVHAVWGGTISCRPELFFEPETTEEIRQIVKAARDGNKKVKVMGSGHSTCHMAMTSDYMISLAKYNRVLHVDKEKGQLKVETGIQMRTLNREVLPGLGLAFSTHPTVDDITLGGVASVGAHGPGENFQILASKFVAYEVMTSSGDVLTISEEKNADLLPAIRLALGSLGIILNITIQFEPAFNLHEEKRCEEFEKTMDRLESLSASADHFIFTWHPHTGSGVVSLLNRTSKPVDAKFSVFWQGIVGGLLYGILLWLCTLCPPLFRPVQWLYYHLMFKHPTQRVDRSDKVLTSDIPVCYVAELTIPRSEGAEAMRDIRHWGLSDRGLPYPYMVTLVTSKKDDIYLSPTYDRDAAIITLIVMRPFDRCFPVEKYFRDFENILVPRRARPHWPVDDSLTSTDLAKLFPKWRTFQDIRRKLDPTGMFMNDFLEQKFGK